MPMAVDHSDVTCHSKNIQPLSSDCIYYLKHYIYPGVIPLVKLQFYKHYRAQQQHG